MSREYINVEDEIQRRRVLESCVVKPYIDDKHRTYWYYRVDNRDYILRRSSHGNGGLGSWSKFDVLTGWGIMSAAIAGKAEYLYSNPSKRDGLFGQLTEKCEIAEFFMMKERAMYIWNHSSGSHQIAAGQILDVDNISEHARNPGD